MARDEPFVTWCGEGDTIEAATIEAAERARRDNPNTTEFRLEETIYRIFPIPILLKGKFMTKYIFSVRISIP